MTRALRRGLTPKPHGGNSWLRRIIPRTMGRRVDGMSIHYHYPGRMHRVWLALLLAFALAAGGVSSAAAPACPMEQAGAAHDCCPDDQPSNDEGSPQDMEACVMGAACRAAPAVAPTLAPLLLPSGAVSVSQPTLGEPAPPSGPLQQLFRPPRTI